MKTPYRIDKELFSDDLKQELDNKINQGDPVSWNTITDKPQMADPHWRSPVATFADLPMVDNVNDDVRLVLDTNEVWSWFDTEWVLIGANDQNIEWTHVQNKPATFPPSTHGHPWSEITEKPTEFTPEAHTHVEAHITDLDKYTQAQTNALLAGKANTAHSHVEMDITDLDKYTQVQVDSALALKSDTTHTHSDLHAHANKLLLDAITQPDIDNWDTVVNKADLTYVNDQLALKAPVTHDHDGRYYTESEVNSLLSAKQNSLISGTNIKTINNLSLLGAGNLDIESGQAQLDELYNVLDITKEPTGFTNPENITVSYDPVTRTVTLTGTFEAYHDGRLLPLITNGWTSPAHADIEGNYYLRCVDGVVTFDTVPWTFSDLMIAYVQYNSHKYGIREVHGLMPWTVHKELHATVGTYRETGGRLTTGSYALNSTTLADRRPLVDAVVVNDEDLPSTITALTTEVYTHRYLTGNELRAFNTGQAEIIPVVGSVPYWNEFNGSTWVQTPFSNGDHGAVFLVAIPTTSDAGSLPYRFMWVQPQTVNSSLTAIQALSPNNLVHGVSSALSSEFCFIGKLIIKYQGGNWTIVQYDLLTGTRVAQVAVAGSTASGVTSFNTRTGDVIPTGGDYTADMITEDSTHRFVTDTEKSTWNAKADAVHSHEIADVTGLTAELANKSDITHDHDGRYFTESEVTSLLSGKANTVHTHDYEKTVQRGTTAPADTTKLWIDTN